MNVKLRPYDTGQGIWWEAGLQGGLRAFGESKEEALANLKARYLTDKFVKETQEEIVQVSW